MNDYARNRSAAPDDSSESLSRYGQLLDLSATTEELLLKHDRSFIFNVDKLDEDETQGQLEAGTAWRVSCARWSCRRLTPTCTRS